MRTQIIDHYKVLGVARNATPGQIKKQYYALARVLHPDVSGADPAKAERFKAITYAYEVLSDSDKRAEFDRELDFAERQSTASSTRQPGYTSPYSYPREANDRLDREWERFISRPVDLARRLHRYSVAAESFLGVALIAGFVYCLVQHVNMDPLIFLLTTRTSRPLQDNFDPIIGVMIGLFGTYLLMLTVWLHAVWKYRSTRRWLRRSSLGLARTDGPYDRRMFFSGYRLRRPSFIALAHELYAMMGSFAILAIYAGAFIGHFCF